jgi:hypothetical protein
MVHQDGAAARVATAPIQMSDASPARLAARATIAPLTASNRKSTQLLAVGLLLARKAAVALRITTAVIAGVVLVDFLVTGGRRITPASVT